MTRDPHDPFGFGDPLIHVQLNLVSSDDGYAMTRLLESLKVIKG